MKLARTLGLLALLAASCGPSGTAVVPAGYPTGRGDLVLRISTGGGFLPQEATFTEVPEFSLYGRGAVMYPGPQIALYPPPALPNILVRGLHPEAIGRILDGAEDAGLSGRDRSFQCNTVADASTTTFTLVKDGARHTTRAYALGECTSEDVSAADEKALAELRAFREGMSDLERYLPVGTVGEEAPYRFEVLRVFVRLARPVEDEAARQEPRDWPLSTPLSEFGETYPGVEGTRCGIVGGVDLNRLEQALRDASTLTPWRSGGEQYTLFLRPLLPDESAC